jgi:hypothetical protein
MQLEGLLQGRRGAVVLSDLWASKRRVVPKASLDASTYGNITGPLLALSTRLGDIKGRMSTDRSNYTEILRDWAATIMHGIMTYNPSGIRPVTLDAVSVDVDRYRALFDKYSTLFHRAFMAENVSATDNYENLEFLGDDVYKTALVFYIWRELKINNKTQATILKHTHENTKALSDLARIFHMDVLARTNKSVKQVDSLYEDVFEAFVGVLQLVQWEIQRDPSSPEYTALCTDCGFANRLVRLIFHCSDAKFEHGVAPKTFVTSLEWDFAQDSERLVHQTKAGSDGPVIVFRTPPTIISRMAAVFGSDKRLLSGILNSTHMAPDRDVHVKKFSAKVYGDVVKMLADPRIGINERTTQMYRTQKVVPKEFYARLGQISAAATAKGYWIDISLPKDQNSTSRVTARGVIRHGDPRRSAPVVEVAGEAGKGELERVVGLLLDEIKTILDRIETIPEKWRNRATVCDFKMNGLEEIDSDGIQVPPHARPAVPRPRWAADTAETPAPGGAPMLASGVAGSNQAAVGAVTGVVRQSTIYEAFNDVFSKVDGGVLRNGNLERAAHDPQMMDSIRQELSTAGDGQIRALCPDESSTGHVLVVFRRAPNGYKAQVNGATSATFVEAVKKLTGLQEEPVFYPKPLTTKTVATKLAERCVDFEKQYGHLLV